MTVAKFNARLKLGMTDAKPALQLAPTCIEDVPDVMSPNGEVMTDGCGWMCPDTMRKLARKQGWKDVPCALQGRLGAAKIQRRRSQIKCAVPEPLPEQCTIEVKAIPTRGCPGALCAEFVQVLGARGIPTATFEELVLEAAACHKGWRPRGAKHLSIPLCQSRRLFVLPDPTGRLKPDEVYLHAGDDVDLSELFDGSGEVVALHNPAVAPEDVVKFRAVDLPELRLHDPPYRHVAVLSVQGDQPPAAWLSGGDYDGDQPLFIWDKRITCVTPLETPGGLSEELRRYVGQLIQQSDLLSELYGLHEVWADRAASAHNAEEQELASQSAAQLVRIYRLSARKTRLVLDSLETAAPPTMACTFNAVGSGAYRYGTRPDGMGELGACDGSSGAPYLTGTAAGKPVPTNDWWSSLVFSRHSFPMYPHPLSLVASAGGLVVAFPQNSPAQEACCTPETYDYRTMDSVGSTNTGQYDLIIGLAGLDSPSTLVSDYTDWTVTAEWRRSEGGDGALWSTFGHGMPMIYSHTAQSEQIHITLNTWHCTFSHELANGGCLSLWYGAVANTADGTPGLSNPDAGAYCPRVPDAEPGAVLGVTIRGVTPSDARPQWESHYALVAAPGCHWEQTTSASAHQVVVRVEAGCSVEAGGPGPEGGQAAVVALLTTASVTELELFAAAAEAFPQNTSVTWAYDAPSAQVSSHFQVSASRMWGGEGAEVTAEPLLALYRHQWRYLAEDTLGEETELVYAPTPRGEMRVRRGSSFSTRYTFRGMVPAWPLAQTEVSDAVYAEVDSEYQATFASGSAAASYWAPRASDTYWGGKDIGRITHLLHTAEQ
eukprot:gene3056-3882_t